MKTRELRLRREGVTADSVLVKLKLPDGSTYAHDGAIQFAEVEGNAGTDTITVRAELPNPERLLVDQLEDDALPAGFHVFIRDYTSQFIAPAGVFVYSYSFSCIVLPPPVHSPTPP